VTDLSVAICTFNRAGLLEAALDSLARVQAPDAAWELVIVDNDEEHPVRDLADRFRDRLPIRYVLETKRGTSFARNRAVDEASAPIVLFTDDDVIFDPGWLRAMMRAIRSEPTCDFWGGRVEPIWPGEPPAWFDTEHCPMLADTVIRYNAGPDNRPWNVDQDLPFYTCNLALRVDAMRRAGGFDTKLGHRGSKRMGGEDTMMIHAITLAGGRGWYAADALLHHPVPMDRLTRSYARSFAWRQGLISIDLLKRQSAGGVPRWVYPISLRKCATGARLLLAGMLRHDAGRTFAGQFQLLFNVSKLCHALASGATRG